MELCQFLGITDVNNDRPKSVPILEALCIVKEVMAETHINENALYISSEENSVGDKLRRGESQEAIIKS